MNRTIHFPDLGMLIFRLVIGLTMALSHGLGKLPPSDDLIGGVGAMGFPMPVVFAWLAAMSEFVGGFLIAAGLFARYAAFFMGFTMAVAFFIVHGADPMMKKELALLYLASCVLIFFSGAGSFSLDRLLRKK